KIVWKISDLVYLAILVVFQAAAAPTFKEKDKNLLNWYIKQLQKSSVKVIFNHEVKDITDLKADDIVIATGGTARKLKFT
ncbi:hypothetical protein CG709_07665, partial [Lachnotalea glycerini]